MLPHLDAAYNIARWLLRDDHNAQDVVQEAYLRAFRFFDSFHGEDARPWRHPPCAAQESVRLLRLHRPGASTESAD